MRIDEPRRDYETSGIDRARGGQLCLAGVANEHNAIATNADVGRSRLLTGAIDEFAVKNKEVELGTLSEGVRPALSNEHRSRKVAREVGIQRQQKKQRKRKAEKKTMYA